FVSKYPAHSGFVGLKHDVEERQRQKVAAYVEEVHNRVAAEPDLERRIHILEDAIQRHPDEASFQEELASVHDLQDRVNSILDRAHAYEASAQYTEALAAWKELETVYNGYPNLQAELGRV